MQVTFPEQRRKITVAVAFDERLESLLEAAIALARRTAAGLRLVHVCDPWTKSYLAPAVEAGPADLAQALRDEGARVADRRLEAVRRSLPNDLSIETEVLDGDLVKSLAADAEANDVGLIVVGASKGGISGTSVGLSTAVSLITEGVAPVLVMNEASRLAPTSERWNIVVADDFTDVSLTALALGFGLAAAGRGSSLVHLHVEVAADLTRGDLSRRAVAGATDAEALTRERLEQVLRTAEERLLARSADRPARLEVAGGHYRMEVVTGTVADEVTRSAIAARAELTLFGQHRAFHRHGDGEGRGRVGQVPFKAMLAQNRPVIVVPHA